MPIVATRILRGDAVERRLRRCQQFVRAPRRRPPQLPFQLGKGQLDRIEVGTVGREKAQLRARRFNRRANRRLFMDREIVEHHDIARTYDRHEHLLDIRQKRGVIDRPIEDRRRRQPVQPQAHDHGMRLPMTARGVIMQARTAGAAAIAAQ